MDAGTGDATTAILRDGTRVRADTLDARRGSGTAGALPTGPGWVATASWTSPTPVESFTAEWEVPEPPSRADGVVLFISAGLQTANTTPTPDLLQATLQFGSNGEEGGPWWGVNCWHQHTAAGAAPRLVVSSLKRVEPGAKLSAVIRRAEVHGKPAWECTIAVAGGAKASLTVVGKSPVAWAYVGLEAYAHEVGRTTYPASAQLAFSALALKGSGSPLSPKWKVSDARGAGTPGMVVHGATGALLKF
jgi:hypothetical protein